MTSKLDPRAIGPRVKIFTMAIVFRPIEDCNFRFLEFVGRVRETQLQVGEALSVYPMSHNIPKKHKKL